MAKKAAWPKEITLTKPVEAHGETLSKLVLNEPNGGDLMTLPMQVEQTGECGGSYTPPTLELASKMAGVPPSTIKQLNSSDTLKVMKVVNPLALACLETLGT